jgi:hypothetical protein
LNNLRKKKSLGAVDEGEVAREPACSISEVPMESVKQFVRQG